MSGEDHHFLTRWSQRKREARQKEAELPAQTPANASTEATQPEEEPFDLSQLPNLESLTAETDISLFMHKAVPEQLRNAALRKMWVLDPAIRNYVGEALDYAWDWNAPGGVPGSGGEITQTALDFARSLFSEVKDHENVTNVSDREKTDIQNDSELTTQEGAPSQPIAQKPPEQGATAGQHDLESEKGAMTTSSRKLRHGGALPRPSTMS